MKRWIACGLLCVGSTAFSAQDVGLGCRHLRTVLDARVTPTIVENDWGSGAVHEAAPATVELVGCDGRSLDRVPLAGPLARIDPIPVRGAPYPTYLVSTDLTADAGTYSGALTILLQVVRRRLDVATVPGSDGRPAPIHLTLTGKAAWLRVSTRAGDAFLQVASRPASGGFATDYRRYDVKRKRWRQKTRAEAGLWEADGDFPPAQRFP